MFSRLTNFLKRIDWLLFFIAFLLVLIGLVVQYSLILNSEKADFTPFYKQLAAFGLGLVLFFSFSYFDFRWFRNYAPLLYIVSLLLLIGLLFFGETLRGTRGWYVLGSISFQPVEIVKIFVLIFLARIFSDGLRKITGPGLWDVVKSGLLVAVVFILILLQPDLGSALLLFGIWFLFFLIIVQKKSHFLLVVSLIIVFCISAWLFFLEDYQKERVLTFLEPNRDPLGIGYQVNQSIIAIGSGKLSGRGLGLGPQSQLRFLPDSSTDFIFSVISEEFGLVGVIVVLGLFALLFWRVISYTKIAYTDFTLLLIVGFLGLILLQVLTNIGMNIGLLPVTGIPLPFMSYGNSNLIAFFTGLGIIQSIKVHQLKTAEFKTMI